MIDLIPIGAENAILLKDLAALTGKAPRTVQADILRLRDEKRINILSSATGGYYLPTYDDKGERESRQYELMMIRQALGRLKRAGVSRQWREEYKQTRFFTGTQLDAIESLLASVTAYYFATEKGGE